MSVTEVIGLVAAGSTTVSFLPQAIKSVQTKDTSGISLIMYSIFTFGTVMWLIYGINSSNLPVSLANGVTLLFSIVILFYKIKYK